jgi:hypothetical protein
MFGQSVHSSFCCSSVALQGSTVVVQMGSDIENYSPFFHTVLHSVFRKQKGSDSVDHQDSPKCIGRHLLEGAQKISCGTVDQDIDVAMFLNN